MKEGSLTFRSQCNFTQTYRVKSGGHCQDGDVAAKQRRVLSQRGPEAEQHLRMAGSIKQSWGDGEGGLSPLPNAVIKYPEKQCDAEPVMVGRAGTESRLIALSPTHMMEEEGGEGERRGNGSKL